MFWFETSKREPLSKRDLFDKTGVVTQKETATSTCNTRRKLCQLIAWVQSKNQQRCRWTQPTEPSETFRLKNAFVWYVIYVLETYSPVRFACYLPARTRSRISIFSSASLLSIETIVKTPRKVANFTRRHLNNICVTIRPPRKKVDRFQRDCSSRVLSVQRQIKTPFPIPARKRGKVGQVPTTAEKETRTRKTRKPTSHNLTTNINVPATTLSKSHTHIHTHSTEHTQDRD